jgi:hypothetical protein
MTESEQPDYPSTPCGQEYRPSERTCIRLWQWIRNRITGLGAIEVFTGVLALSTVFQVLAFIHSERAYLIISDIRFLHSEPTADPDGYDLVMIIKNIGKHVALISELEIKPAFFVIRKTLPEIPNYNIGTIEKVVPPIVPDKDVTVHIHAKGVTNSTITDEERLRGVISGDIPVRVFGYVEYDIGYLSFSKGIIGFCFEYIPRGTRPDITTFETCNDKNYTYIR